MTPEAALLDRSSRVAIGTSDEKGTHTSSRDDRRFAGIVTSIFAVYVALLSALHEPWADETQAWRLAIDSDGLAALVWNARYEGHPLLFHVLLQFVGHLSRSWWAAVAFHAAVACGIVWIIARHSPFNRLARVLLVVNYYVAYEYAVIVRPYGLGMLLALGACLAWTGDRRRPVVTAILLALLANTSVLGTLLALAAAAAIAFEGLAEEVRKKSIARRTVATMAGYLVAGALVLWLVVTQVVPPADAGFKGMGAATKSVSVWEIGAGLTVPLRAMTPVAAISEGVVHWNLWLFSPMSRLALAVQILASCAVVLIGCAIAMRRWTSLLFFLGGTCGFVLFFELFFAGHPRHHGYLVIVWIMSAWLSLRGAATRWPMALQPVADRARRLAPLLFTVSLIPMSVAGVEFAAGEALHQFSDSRRVADFLEDRGLRDGPLVAITRPDAQSVSALVDRPIVFPYQGRAHTFIPWGDTRLGTPDEVAAVTDSLLGSACRVTVIATTHEDVALPLRESMPIIYETPRAPMSQRKFRIRLKSAPPSARCPAPPP